MSRKIVDCFTFYNELDLLEVRLRELYDVVDYFVIVEAMQNYSGEIKGSIFTRERERFEWAERKIVHILLGVVPLNVGLSRQSKACFEILQRNEIMTGLSKIQLDGKDLILISDLDEIPRAEQVEQLGRYARGSELYVFKMKFHKYFVNNVGSQGSDALEWLGTVACQFNTLKAILPHAARIGDPMAQRSGCLANNYPRELAHFERWIENGGWHLSYMGGIEAIIRKAKNMVDSHDLTFLQLADGQHILNETHNDFEFRSKNPAYMERLIRYMDARFHPVGRGADVVDIDLPEYLRQNKEKFLALFFLHE